MARIPWVLATGLLVFSLGCAREQPKQPAATPHPKATSLQGTLMIGQVYATANGGAYVSSLLGRVYFVFGETVQPVTGLPPRSGGQLVPLADGSALLAASFATPPALYWLRGSTATLVVEGEIASMPPTGISESGFYFARSEALRAQLADLQDELAESEASRQELKDQLETDDDRQEEDDG